MIETEEKNANVLCNVLESCRRGICNLDVCLLSFLAEIWIWLGRVTQCETRADKRIERLLCPLPAASCVIENKNFHRNVRQCAVG